MKNKKDFLQKLLFWTKSFDPICLLDSNNSTRNQPKAYKNFNFLCAVGAKQVFKPTTNNFAHLKSFQQQNKDWIFGYFAYDLKNEIEDLTSNNLDYLHFPITYFFVPEHVFIVKSQLLIVETYLNKSQTEVMIKDILSQQNEKIQTKSITLQKRETKEVYFQKIQSIKKHIQQGDIYEMNYCQEFFAENITIKPEEMFLELNQKAKAPFSAFFKANEKYLLSFSPERFLRKQQQKLLSQPIKGTIKRSENRLEDRIQKKILKNSEKDRIENVMITDLVRNDLSKFAEKSSVKVEELFGVYTFEKVHHMISTISAALLPSAHFLDAIRGAFPMGSMTGAPKKRAMELIEQLETTKRGLFSGSVGYITPKEDFDFNVVIRSILYNANNAYLSVMTGGAITSKSQPEQEYQESVLKAQSFLQNISAKIK